MTESTGAAGSVGTAEDAAVLRGDLFDTITPTMWRLMMDGQVVLRNDEAGVWYAVPPPPLFVASAVLPGEVSASGGTVGSDLKYTKAKAKAGAAARVEFVDPRACISCGDKSSPLHPSGECDSCLSDRLSGEFSE